TRKQGTRVYYSLAGDDVAHLQAEVRDVAARLLAEVAPARLAYLGEDVEMISPDELLRRARSGEGTLLDGRPAAQYAPGHHPGGGLEPRQRARRPARRAPCRYRRRRLLPRTLLRLRPRCGAPAPGERPHRAPAVRWYARVAAGGAARRRGRGAARQPVTGFAQAPARMLQMSGSAQSAGSVTAARNQTSAAS